MEVSFICGPLQVDCSKGCTGMWFILSFLFCPPSVFQIFLKNTCYPPPPFFLLFFTSFCCGVQISCDGNRHSSIYFLFSMPSFFFFFGLFMSWSITSLIVHKIVRKCKKSLIRREAVRFWLSFVFIFVVFKQFLIVLVVSPPVEAKCVRVR